MLKIFVFSLFFSLNLYPCDYELGERPSEFDQETFSALKVVEAQIKRDRLQSIFTSKFTNPKAHDSSKFQYLIHAFKEEDLLNLDSMQRQRFENPEVLNSLLLSMGIINESYSKSWGNIAYIMDVPKENILFTAPTNVYLDNSLFNVGKKSFDLIHHLLNLYKRYGFKSPNEITKLSSIHEVNEVGVLGTSVYGTRVKIKGILISGEISETAYQLVRKMSKIQELPIIEI